MVQMLFFLRFRSQLRRTRPDLVARLDETITGAIFAAGGRLSDNRRYLNASFDSDRIGFWLDMLILTETIQEALEKAGTELSGHALVLNRDIPEHDCEKLCRTLSSSAAASHTGIWCGQTVTDALQPYCFFEKPYRGYAELVDFRAFGNPGPEKYFPYREKIMRVLAADKKENALLMGSLIMGIRDGVYQYCKSITEMPPLIIRFGDEDSHACFSDALSPEITALLAGTPENFTGELESLGGLLFRERMRDQATPFITDAGKRFLTLLLNSYTAAVLAGSSRAVIIIEDPLAADENSLLIFKEAFASLKNKKDVLVIGVNTNESENYREWGGIFTKILKFSSGDFPETIRDFWKLPQDIWEILYAAALLRRFSPAVMFPRIFEDEGYNPGILKKALELLSLMGVIDSVDDPKPRISDFFIQAEKILGQRKEKIKSMVRNRIIAWELADRIRPCFNMIRFLDELGGVVEDSLFLRVLRSEINNRTCDGLGEAFTSGQINQLTKKENVRLLKWIFNTWKTLVFRNQDEIRSAFKDSDSILPVSSGQGIYPGFRAQVLTNLCAYRLGIGDAPAAVETVKELMLLNQDLKDGGFPSYRYFSLLNLFKSRFDDTLEYGTFAMELAEKTGNNEELVKASFFSASANFLYGNLSGAQRYILKAEKTALDLGWPEWALRSKFFLGRFHFENGHYLEALDIFESLEGSVPAGNEESLASWIFRSRVYLSVASNKGPKKIAWQPDLTSAESLLFNVEAAFLFGNYEEAISLAEKFPPESGNADFFYTEQPDWKCGFSQCELMLPAQKNLQSRLVSVYQILAQSCLPLKTGEAEILRNKIQRLVREELLPEGDANDAFYLYAWYLILVKTGVSLGDTGTAVSMAFKKLQRRSGRIDATECRHDYLSLNYWNRALSLAARENKLI